MSNPWDIEEVNTSSLQSLLGAGPAIVPAPVGSASPLPVTAPAPVHHVTVPSSQSLVPTINALPSPSPAPDVRSTPSSVPMPSTTTHALITSPVSQQQSRPTNPVGNQQEPTRRTSSSSSSSTLEQNPIAYQQSSSSSKPARLSPKQQVLYNYFDRCSSSTSIKSILLFCVYLALIWPSNLFKSRLLLGSRIHSSRVGSVLAGSLFVTCLGYVVVALTFDTFVRCALDISWIIYDLPLLIICFFVFIYLAVDTLTTKVMGYKFFSPAHRWAAFWLSPICLAIVFDVIIMWPLLNRIDSVVLKLMLKLWLNSCIALIPLGIAMTLESARIDVYRPLKRLFHQLQKKGAHSVEKVSTYYRRYVFYSLGISSQDKESVSAFAQFLIELTVWFDVKLKLWMYRNGGGSSGVEELPSGGGSKSKDPPILLATSQNDFCIATIEAWTIELDKIGTAVDAMVTCKYPWFAIPRAPVLTGILGTAEMVEWINKRGGKQQ